MPIIKRTNLGFGELCLKCFQVSQSGFLRRQKHVNLVHPVINSIHLTLYIIHVVLRNETLSYCNKYIHRNLCSENYKTNNKIVD